MGVALHRTVCNRDCPDACGLIAHVDDGRLVRLAGDPDHPVTKGFLCHRTSRFPERQNAPDRLTTPLLRRNGALEPVSWEEALGFAAARLLAIREESGPAAILHYRSGGSLGLLKSVVDLFWEAFGPVSVKRGDICSGAGDAAQETDFGEEESHDLFDLRHARHVLLWGKNPKVSNVHLVPVLMEARKRGTRTILVDPVRHASANLADRYVTPRPGGDFALAMGAAALLFERGAVAADVADYTDGLGAFEALAKSRSADAWARDADVPLEDVDAIAGALADRPCNIQVGWGMGRRTNGSAIVRALDALGAVSGNLGIPGGGVSFYFKRRGAFDTSFLRKTYPRTLLEPRLGREILDADPPVRAIWVTAGNPVAMLPDASAVARAFETRELVVVVDSFPTDTTRRAHLVLPAATLVEDDDLLGAYGNHWIGASTPALAPPPDVKTDLEIVQALAAEVDRRTGAGAGAGLRARVAGTARDWKRRVARRVEAAGISVEELEARSVRNPFVSDVLFADRRFATPTSRANLVTAAPGAPEDEPGFPLWLFSNSTEKAQSSQWAGSDPEVAVATCHPSAATGFADGDPAWLESAIGRIRVTLRFDARQRRDVVIVPKGGHYDRGTCANVLIRARTTDAGEGAAYQDCRVRIRPDAQGAGSAPA